MYLVSRLYLKIVASDFCAFILFIPIRLEEGGGAMSRQHVSEDENRTRSQFHFQCSRSFCIFLPTRTRRPMSYVHIFSSSGPWTVVCFASPTTALKCKRQRTASGPSVPWLTLHAVLCRLHLNVSSSRLRSCLVLFTTRGAPRWAFS